jgi:hypothetical protein
MATSTHTGSHRPQVSSVMIRWNVWLVRFGTHVVDFMAAD